MTVKDKIIWSLSYWGTIFVVLGIMAALSKRHH